MTFQAKLALEGLKGALDRLPEAAQRSLPVGLISPVGSQQPGAVGGDELVELAAGKALVGQNDQAWVQLGVPMSNMAVTTSRSPSLGLARHQATGSPSGAASTYNRKPQK